MNIYENDSIGFIGDISGNELENGPEAYNVNSFADMSSNIDSLNIEGPCNDLKGNIDRCISEEYDKYAFFIKDDNNLYREIATQFGDIKNSVLEDFKDTDIFIEFILISPFIFCLKDDLIFYIFNLFFDVTKQKTPHLGVLYSYLEEIKF